MKKVIEDVTIIQSEDKQTRIRKVLAVRDSLANTFAEITTYGWDNNFKWQIIREAQPNIQRQIGRVDFSDFNEDELKLCGFKRWSEETNLHLIPFWLYPYMAYGIKLTSIDGHEIMTTPTYTASGTENYIDYDHRYGCLAFGIIPKKEQEETENEDQSN